MSKVQKYPKPKLVTLPSKSAFWYVEVVKPRSISGKFYQVSRKSTKCKNKSDAYQQVERLKDEIYTEFDKVLGIESDPFTALIGEGLEKLNALVVKGADSNLAWAFHFTQFLVDDNEKIKSADNWYRYMAKMMNQHDYKPLITERIRRNPSVDRLTDTKLKFDPAFNYFEKDAWEEQSVFKLQSGYNYWDYTIEWLHYRQTFHEYNSLKSLGEYASIPFFLDYIPDIFETYHNSELTAKDYIEQFGRSSAIALCYFANDGVSDAINDLFPLLDLQTEHQADRPEAHLLRNLIDFFDRKNEKENPLPAHLRKIEINRNKHGNTSINKPQSKLNIKFENPSNCPKITDLLPAYYKDAKWNTISDNNRKATPQLISKCIEIIGDKPINQIYRSDGKEIAKYLDNYQHGKTASQRIAHNTILDYTKALKGFLNWAMDIKDTSVVPAVEWLTGNPFTGVDTRYLADYGLPPRGYEALTPDQLKALFKLDMGGQDRLLLNILAMTGMRLNEVQLLEWHQLKRGTTEVDKHIRYFDLTGSKLKNDRYALRNVVLPSILKLPEAGDGRIFNYTGGRDDTTSREASKQINKYFHTIRLPDGHTDIVKPYQQDNRKVVHSLRNNMRGFLINLRNPAVAPEVIDWICGWGAKDGQSESVGRASYGADPDLITKYDALERLNFSFLNTPRLTDERKTTGELK